MMLNLPKRAVNEKKLVAYGMLISSTVLTGCSTKSIDNFLMATSGNAQIFFDGQLYNLTQASLGSQYLYQHGDQALIIERQTLSANLNFEQFKQSRLQTEQVNRKHDCQIEPKSHAKGIYYTCQYTLNPAGVLYTFSTDGKYGYFKAYTNKQGIKDEVHKAGKLIDYDTSYLSN